LALAGSLAPAGRLDAAGLVAATASLVRGAVSASLTVVPGRGSPRTLDATDQLPRDVDALQYSLQEGPCLEAIQTDDLALADDLRTDERWPSFGPECAARFNVHSMLGVRLLLDGPERGALNLYASAPHAFTDDDVDLAATLAPFISVVLQNELYARKVTDLETALTSSRSIGTAVGILMVRHLITGDEAFARLSRTSQQLNRKLRDLAAQVELTGDLPLPAGDTR
jgi:GAF domain-containing protein